MTELPIGDDNRGFVKNFVAKLNAGFRPAGSFDLESRLCRSSSQGCIPDACRDLTVIRKERSLEVGDSSRPETIPGIPGVDGASIPRRSLAVKSNVISKGSSVVRPAVSGLQPKRAEGTSSWLAERRRIFEQGSADTTVKQPGIVKNYFTPNHGLKKTGHFSPAVHSSDEESADLQSKNDKKEQPSKKEEVKVALPASVEESHQDKTTSLKDSSEEDVPPVKELEREEVSLNKSCQEREASVEESSQDEHALGEELCPDEKTSVENSCENEIAAVSERAAGTLDREASALQDEVASPSGLSSHLAAEVSESNAHKVTSDKPTISSVTSETVSKAATDNGPCEQSAALPDVEVSTSSSPVSSVIDQDLEAEKEDAALTDERHTEGEEEAVIWPTLTGGCDFAAPPVRLRRNIDGEMEECPENQRQSTVSFGDVVTVFEDLLAGRQHLYPFMYDW